MNAPTAVAGLTTEAAPRQSTTLVARAEVRRLLRRGGMRGGVIAAGVSGTALGLVTLLALTALMPDAGHIAVTSPLEVGAFIANLVIAIAIVLAIGRDNAGHLAIALAVTPARGRLYRARVIAVVLIAAPVAAGASLTVGIIGSALDGFAHVGLVITGVLLCALAGASLAVVSFGIATLVRRSSAGLLALIGLLIVLPLIVGALGGLVPAQFSPVVQAIASATPANLMLQGIGVSTIPTNGLLPVLLAQAGLAAWAVAAAAASRLAFVRRDF